MLDQAQDLRRLATQRGRPKAARAAGRPTLLVVTGGKGGVGTTTVALRLAAAIAQAGKRTLLVDADPRGGDAALQCGIEERYTLGDLLAGRRSWAEVIEASPGGVQLVAGDRWSEHENNGLPTAAERLLELLGDPGLRADVAVIDIGNSPDRAFQRLCRAADAVVVVTTGETAAVVNTFATIRALSEITHDRPAADGIEPAFPFYLWVNMAQDMETVHYRLGRACQRLLGIQLRFSKHCDTVVRYCMKGIGAQTAVKLEKTR